MYTMKTIFFILLCATLILSNTFLVSAELNIEFNDDDLPKVVMGIEDDVVTFNNNTGAVNTSDFWDGLDIPTDITNSEFWYNHTLHVFNLYNSTWDNRALINTSWTQSYADNIYVPYTGATNDVVLGSNDFWARDINATDDLFVNDDAKIGDNLDIGGQLEVTETSLFKDNMHLEHPTGDAIFEIETLNTSSSSQLRLLADGSNDLYIYTYGSSASGDYYGFPRANTSYVDAIGQRLIIGTFDTSPLYLATHRNARIELTSDGSGFIPIVDDDIDLGNISNRWQDLYLTGEEDFGLHFVEDDGLMGNLSMNDGGDLLWNGIPLNTSAINSSFNQASTDTLYAGIEWDYNQSLATFNMWNSTWDNRGTTTGCPVYDPATGIGCFNYTKQVNTTHVVMTTVI